MIRPTQPGEIMKRHLASLAAVLMLAACNPLTLSGTASSGGGTQSLAASEQIWPRPAGEARVTVANVAAGSYTGPAEWDSQDAMNLIRHVIAE